jgi:hypothetical protein
MLQALPCPNLARPGRAGKDAATAPPSKGVLAIVEPAFTIDGKPQKAFSPIFFVQIGQHWKVSIKK